MGIETVFHSVFFFFIVLFPTPVFISLQSRVYRDETMGKIHDLCLRQWSLRSFHRKDGPIFPKSWRRNILEALLGVQYFRSVTVKMGHSWVVCPLCPTPRPRWRARLCCLKDRCTGTRWQPPDDTSHTFRFDWHAEIWWCPGWLTWANKEKMYSEWQGH